LNTPLTLTDVHCLTLSELNDKQYSRAQTGTGDYLWALGAQHNIVWRHWLCLTLRSI